MTRFSDNFLNNPQVGYKKNSTNRASGSARSVGDLDTQILILPQYDTRGMPSSGIKVLTSGHQNRLRGRAMDIPNDLNKLLARLKEVNSDASRMPEAWASGPRPSTLEIDFFLGQYHFDADAVIEPIEIAKDGVFEFYVFAVSNRSNDDLSLLAMWPEQKGSAEQSEPN